MSSTVFTATFAFRTEGNEETWRERGFAKAESSWDGIGVRVSGKKSGLRTYKYGPMISKPFPLGAPILNTPLNWNGKNVELQTKSPVSLKPGDQIQFILYKTFTKYKPDGRTVESRTYHENVYAWQNVDPSLIAQVGSTSAKEKVALCSACIHKSSYPISFQFRVKENRSCVAPETTQMDKSKNEPAPAETKNIDSSATDQSDDSDWVFL